ncbi:MAG TPA: radical SAM protein, partial [Candidatus Lokiarchaeia archaeon]|nr:radical SAM protein [Candidatus Lokiarchaeia archaeon]
MDVLLISAGDLLDEQYHDKEYDKNQVAMPPLGLLYLGQVLVNNSYDVKVYDQNVTGVRNAELMETLIKKWDPHIIGVSTCIHNYWTTIDLVRRIKEWNPNAIIVAGNYIATFFPDKLMQEEPVDYCIRGEAEYSFLDLVNRLMRGEQVNDEIKGLVYRERGIIKTSPIPEPIKDIDSIPIPDRRLIDFGYQLQHKSTSIMTSRGCPNNCRFCYFSSIMGRRWRARSVDNLIEELSMLKSQGYKDIVLGDSNFNLNKKRTLHLCAEIKKNGLDSIAYSGDMRVDGVNYDVMRSLQKVNFGKILFGIESGNQRILDYYNKGITIAQVQQAVKTANKARLDVIMASFIIGATDETLSEVITTIKFANKLDISFASFQLLLTIPISPIYQELVERGYYKPQKDDWKKS